MKSQFTFEIKKDYLQLNVTGSYDKEVFLKLPSIIKARCEKEKIFKILVNALELRNADLSTVDRFFLGEQFAKEFQDYIHLAVLWPARYIDKFAETVAQNRGGKMFVTGDFESAEEWLIKSPFE